MPDFYIPDPLTYNCTAEDDELSFSHPNTCDFWFFCRDEKSSILECGQGAIFDEDSRKCTAREFATCPHDPPTTTEETTVDNNSTDSTVTENTTITTSTLITSNVSNNFEYFPTFNCYLAT